MARGQQEPGEAGTFPRAPTQQAWESMSAQERARAVAALPGEVTWEEMAPPEGDRHFQAKVRALDALKGYFTRQRRKVYLAAELPVYYPGEKRFATDLLAVLDVEPHERDKWVVSAEGKGLNFVLEVHVGGDRKKDASLNVERYARLGIPELLESEEFVALLEEMMTGLHRRADEASQRAEEEAQRAQEEAQRAQEIERRLAESERRIAELQAEVEHLKKNER
ncbi:Uma2 family endonuclease [Stigmatella aurantiaca]|uniref:Conserved uncharacterized protein n=1 Tax=Stigmatella aurantiaca (strain DW4/3-1) TaxID=378806 RepID=Q095X5_STIAD|nr:Uma2 family endonuclease [Stigmatella aurantiaca]ADO74957.1 conserved uncharacterized protein [Stigmatella aurantiaca DW4/3-1]EAU67545.1 conserved hypothetical protein [Stigmatella aurantiaca DW4/3-1]